MVDGAGDEDTEDNRADDDHKIEGAGGGADSSSKGPRKSLADLEADDSDGESPADSAGSKLLKSGSKQAPATAAAPGSRA